jgi:hypothetical protein
MRYHQFEVAEMLDQSHAQRVFDGRQLHDADVGAMPVAVTLMMETADGANQAALLIRRGPQDVERAAANSTAEQTGQRVHRLAEHLVDAGSLLPPAELPGRRVALDALGSAVEPILDLVPRLVVNQP